MSASAHKDELLAKKLDSSNIYKSQFQDSVFQDSTLMEVADQKESNMSSGAQSELPKGKSDAQDSRDEKVRLPGLGVVSVATSLRVLYTFFVLFLGITFALTYLSFQYSEALVEQTQITGDALTQNQRVARMSSDAMLAIPDAFEQLQEAIDHLHAAVEAMPAKSTLANFPWASHPTSTNRPEEIGAIVERLKANVDIILQNRKIIDSAAATMHKLNEHSARNFEIIQEISSRKHF